MKKCVKSGVALLLAFTVMFSAASALISLRLSAASSIDGYYFEEDFADGTLSNWETPHNSDTYAVKQLDGANVLTFDYKNSAQGKQYTLVPKSSAVSQSTVEEFAFTAKFSKAPSSLYGGLEIVYDYTDKDNYKFVTIGEFNNNIFRRFWAVKDGNVGTDGSAGAVDASMGSINIDFTDWFTVGVSYTDSKANITVKQGGESKSLSVATSSTPAMLCNYRQNGNESSTVYVNNVKFYFGGYSDYLAKQYTDKYSAVLSKTLQQITVSDETLVNAALDDYSRLSAAYQTSYYNYIIRLNGFKEKIDALKSGTSFDDTDPTHLANWQVLKGTVNASNFTVDANGDIILSSNVMVKLDPASYLGENQAVKKFTYSVEYSSGNSGGKGIFFVYDYTDADNYSYNTIWYDKTHNAFFNQYFKCEDGKEKSTGTGYANELKSIEGKLDVEIDLTKSGKYIYKVTNSAEDTVFTHTASSVSELKNLILYANTAVKISNVKAYAYDEDDFTAFEKEIKLFNKNYAELLNLTSAQFTKNALMKADIEKAIYDYENNLQAYPKEVLKEKYLLLKNMLAAIEGLPGEYVTALPEYTDGASGRYYKWTDGFENGMGKWSNSGTGGNNTVTPSPSIYDMNGNPALTVGGHGFVYPSSYTVPEKAQLSEVKFKVKLNGTEKFYENKPLTIMLSFVDENNWQVLEIYNWLAGRADRTSYRISSCVDGTYSGGYHNGNKCQVIDFYSDYLEVTVKYDSTGRNVSVELTDGKNTDTFGTSLTVSYGRFGLWGQNGFNWQYDDVEITYVPGEWEEDRSIESIYPYYSGNTEYGPDDVLTIYGENIYDNISRIEFVQIPDADYKNALLSAADTGSFGGIDTKFLPEISYSHDKQKSGNYIFAANEAYWDASRAVRLRIQQPSKNSVKVILPTVDANGDSITQGIYALKLCGNDSSGRDDVIIYINNPETDYVYGDDGDHATQGGTLRIIGENMALGYDEIDRNDFIEDSDEDIAKYNKAMADVKYKVYVKIAGNGYSRVFSTVNNDVVIQSMNGLTVNLPKDIPLGEYEVTVFNGFGDSGCWSAPVKMTVGTNVRSTWPDAVYDITNYGASASDADQDITGILMDVIQLALDRTDGGIIRIPAGRYKLIYSIVIPEKIQLVGDGSDKTILYWDPTQWKMDSCPSFLIGFEKNIAIEGIGFYGTRGQCIIRSYGGKNTQNSTDYNENVYLKDVNVQFQPLLGVASGGSGVGVLIGSEAEVQNLIRAECTATNSYGMFVSNPYNLQMDEVTIYRTVTNCPLIFSWGRYVHINKCKITDEWQHGNINNVIIEYTEFARTTLGYQGDNVYYHGNTIYDRTINNRELFVADGSPASLSGNANAIITLATPEECVLYGYTYGYAYRVISGWGEQHDMVQLYVRNGQGIGQTRLTTSYMTKTAPDGTRTTYVTVSEPFTVAPNSNSRVVARAPRENMYFSYMYYENGLATGYFGGFADTIYNRCYWNHVTDIYFDSYNSDLNWYLSIVNGTFVKAYNFHDIGTSAWKTDYGSIIFTSQNSQAYSPTSSIRFYGNNLDGYQLYMKSAYSEGVRDVVIQNNEWDGSFTAVSTLGKAESCDGIFIYKNILNDNERFLSNVLSGSNSVGSKRIIHYVSGDRDGFQVGDINGDGAVTLKDVTLLKYYLSGELTLGEEQLARADFYADGEINLADALAIRHYCSTGEVLSPDDADDDEWYDIIL